MCDCDCPSHQWDDDDDPTQQQGWVPPEARLLATLPKRRRLFLPSATIAPKAPVASPATVAGASPTHLEGEDDSDSEEQQAREARAGRLEVASVSERLGEGEEDYQARMSAYEHFLENRGDPPDVSKDPDRGSGAGEGSTKTTNSFEQHDEEGSARSGEEDESPPTSPELSRSEVPFEEGEEEEEERAEREKTVRPPDHFALFGEEGQRITQSLSTASSFSPAGLFGGLGLATLHPSLSPPEHAHDHGHDHEHDHDHRCEEDEDGDEDTYGVVDRSRPPVETSDRSQDGATALGVGGSNKKKRKVPGLHAAGGGGASGDEDGGDGMDRREPARPLEYASERVPIKAPVNPPTTAKAALAKLRIRPPHISLCTSCFTARRHRRKRHRANSAKQHPLPLPHAPDFVPPAMLREGPPPLPPGSGLKGSKALKAAMKAHREREKEKERIRKLFEHVKVPDLYDPDGTANPSTLVVSRAIKADLARRRAEGRSLPVKHDTSAYPTPPGSSDEGESEVDAWTVTHWTLGPPELDLFQYSEKPSSVLEARWTALNEQKERLKAAKARAAKAREEEKERRKEKQEKERAEAAAASAAEASSAKHPHPPPVPGAPPTPAATPKRNPSSAARPPPPPASTSSSHPPALPPAAALPPPPPLPFPPPPPKHKKKGRKKRSAHANAHNPHHANNWFPSRVPQSSSSTQHDASSSSSTPALTSWPASAEAIADAGEYANTCGGGHLCSPDEWLCLFCDYRLFYGEASLLEKALKKRRGVVGRRKKAAERARRATQGPAAAGGDDVADEDEAEGAQQSVEA